MPPQERGGGERERERERDGLVSATIIETLRRHLQFNSFQTAVVYFDQLSGAARTLKLVKILFSAVFNIFCSFQTFFSYFTPEITENKCFNQLSGTHSTRKLVKKHNKPLCLSSFPFFHLCYSLSIKPVRLIIGPVLHPFTYQLDL